MFWSPLLLIVNLHHNKHVNMYLFVWHLYFGHCNSGCFPCVCAQGHSGKSIVIFFFFFLWPVSNLSLFAQSLISHYVLSHLLDICFSAAYSLLVQPNAAMCIHCGGQEGGPSMETRECCSHLQLSNFHWRLVQGFSGNSVLCILVEI